MNKKILRLFSALAVGAACFSLAGGTETAMALPNPMVSYESVAAARDAAGFQPLYLPSISGYRMNQVWVIGGDVIDMEYVSEDLPASKFRLRTARCTERMNEDISGIYGVKWEEESINGLTIAIADVPGASNSYAAHWRHNNMLFSVSVENMTNREFRRLLEYGLAEVTINCF